MIKFAPPPSPDSILILSLDAIRLCLLARARRFIDQPSGVNNLASAIKKASHPTNNAEKLSHKANDFLIHLYSNFFNILMLQNFNFVLGLYFVEILYFYIQK